MFLHEDPTMPAMRVASCYEMHTNRDRHSMVSFPDPLSKEACLFLSGFNATTAPEHATAIEAQFWPWLMAKQRSKALVDPSFLPPPPVHPPPLVIATPLSKPQRA